MAQTNLEFRGNSITENREKKKNIPKKIVTQPVTTDIQIHKNPIKNFWKSFVATDLNYVKNKLITDVIIPETQKAILDLAYNGLSVLFYGDSSPKSHGGPSYRNRSPFDYTGIFDQPARKKPEMRIRNYVTLDEIDFSDKATAERVLDRLREIISEYHYVRVSDFYDAVGYTSDYTYTEYGWDNLDSAKAVYNAQRRRWMIDFPKYIPLS